MAPPITGVIKNYAYWETGFREEETIGDFWVKPKLSGPTKH